MPDATYKTQAGDVLDAICHKFYQGRPGALDAVLKANEPLMASGALAAPKLPAGLLLTLPELPEHKPARIYLWD